jgi:hypothetical protein
MNYITTNHQGGLCNTLFKLSAAISTALDNKVEYLFSNEFVRIGYDPDYNEFKNNIYRNINFIDTIPNNYVNYYEKNFSYNDIGYVKGTNLLLNGYYQSEKYFINNKDYIINLFKPTEEIKNFIINKITDIQNSISIHVRRGDYLNLPDYHPQQPIEYYHNAVNFFGLDKNYIIFSDDIDGAMGMLDFIPNKKAVSLGKDYLDLYAISLCEHNIICNSTFGWWGAYLNENKNKKIIAPNLWFGPSASHLNASDIIPKNWIKL